MKQAVILLALVASLAGCGAGDKARGLFDRPVFDGQEFRLATSSDRKNRKAFTASARPASASTAGAIEAAQFAATRHCLKYYGTSDMTWTRGPDLPPEELIADDTLTLTGQCRDR